MSLAGTDERTALEPLAHPRSPQRAQW